ncbi:MAG TPA: hypothetical protein VIK33_13150, partial [Anaerolineae bacterium]
GRADAVGEHSRCLQSSATAALRKSLFLARRAANAREQAGLAVGWNFGSICLPKGDEVYLNRTSAIGEEW